VPEFEQRFRVAAPLERVRAFHGSTDALRRLTPPGVRVQLHESGPVQEGSVARFTLWFGPFPVRWTARHEHVSEGGFDDVQAEGPLASWRHRHRFVPVMDGGTEIIDRISYAHRPGWTGVWTRILFGRLPLTLNFRFRRWATERSLGRSN
jgi:ligand-binding SRPBCC domain-containing protein